MLSEDVSKASGVFVVVAGRNFVLCLPPRMVLFSNETPVCSVVKGGKKTQTKTKQIIQFNLLYIFFFPYKHTTSEEKCVYSETFPTISLCFERKLRMQ